MAEFNVLEKCIWLKTVARVPSINMGEAGFIAYTAVSHQVLI